MAQQYRLGTRSTTFSRGGDGTLRVTYHNTDVVSVAATGAITLDSGGWRSHTTKTRMNQAAHQFGLDFSVSQKDYAWFVDYRGKRVPFVDGMVL